MHKLLCALVALPFLTACSSDSSANNNLPKLLKEGLTSAVKSRRAGPLPVINLTPDQLAATKIAALQVNPEITGGSDFLRRIERRNDSEFGTIEVWRSSDNAQIFLRNGVLVGSRGIGRDIVSSAASATVQAVSQARAGSGNRTYQIDNGDNTAQVVQLSCRIENLGLQEIIVVHQSFTTTRLQESCTGGPAGTNKIVNNYWVQANSGLVKKSRQWAGPAIGYFEMILLKN